MLGILVRIALQMVRETGLEPARLAALPPQGSASAISPLAHEENGKQLIFFWQVLYQVEDILAANVIFF